jgi:threonine synthase
VWLSIATIQANSAVRAKLNFDFDWMFILADDTSFSAEAYKEDEWEAIRLPHDWNVKMKFDSKTSGSAGYIPESIGWYRKHFIVPQAYKGKNVSVLFDGIFHQSDVYVNGKHLGFRPYGFCSIEYDLTPYLNYGGDNVIAVRVNCTGERPRWYTGAGVYRRAWLQVVNPVHVATYGTYVTTPEVSERHAKIQVVTTVKNGSEADGKLEILQTIYNSAGKEMAKECTKGITLAAGLTSDIKQTMTVNAPELWDIDSPVLYTMKTEVKMNGKKMDVYDTSFGIRTMEFDCNKGFLLNGRRVKLHGVCLHQDAGCMGTAVTERADERRLEILKEYGCNAVRCSHNQPSSEFLDLCDRMGFVVLNEAFDKWKSGYYGQYFDDWWQKDLKNMLLRDRNHPSIALWSIGNELSEAWRDSEEGVERAKMLQDFVHEFEPSRMVMLAAQNNHKSKFSGVTDVIGYNYLEERMLSDHKKYPERRFLISEELPYYRGAEGNLRSYGTDNPWNIIAANDFVAGGFIWPGADYWGEAGWPSKGWPNGLFDVCMFEKPRAAFHRAMWNKKPMVSIAVMDQSLDIDHGRDLWQWPRMASLWNFPDSYHGLVMEIRTTTNCEEVELYLNEKLMGRKQTSDFSNHTIVWNVPYQPGTLVAKGFNRGVQESEYTLITSGKTHHLTLTPDRDIIKADGYDLSFIKIELKDENGLLVQTDNRRLTAYLEGEGRLMGIDSGDLRREDTIASNCIRSYFGKAMVVVQSHRKPGKMILHVKMEGTDETYAVEINSVSVDK